MAFLAPAALFIAGNIAAAGLFYGASKVLDYATGNSYYAQKAEQNKEKEEERNYQKKADREREAQIRKNEEVAMKIQKAREADYQNKTKLIF